MAIESVLASLDHLRCENDLELDGGNSLLFRFAVMAALNNALDVTDENESLQELFEKANALYVRPLTHGSIASGHEQRILGSDEQGQAFFREWEAVFQANAAMMKLHSLGLLHDTYAALAA